MSRAQIENDIQMAVINQDPYATYLVRALQTMTEPQVDYFMNQVAPYYMYGEGLSPLPQCIPSLALMITLLICNNCSSNSMVGKNLQKQAVGNSSVKNMYSVYAVLDSRGTVT